mgnify:CR=1 FL=1
MYKSKLPIEKLYDLFQSMLRLEKTIRETINHKSPDHLKDEEFILGILYEKDHALFSQFLEYEKQTIKKTKLYSVLLNLFRIWISLRLQQLPLNSSRLLARASKHFWMPTIQSICTQLVSTR